MLNKLMAMTRAELQFTIQSIDATAVKGRALRRQLASIRKKEGGFTWDANLNVTTNDNKVTKISGAGSDAITTGGISGGGLVFDGSIRRRRWR